MWWLSDKQLKHVVFGYYQRNNQAMKRDIHFGLRPRRIFFPGLINASQKDDPDQMNIYCVVSMNFDYEFDTVSIRDICVFNLG